VYNVFMEHKLGCIAVAPNHLSSMSEAGLSIIYYDCIEELLADETNLSALMISSQILHPNPEQKLERLFFAAENKPLFCICYAGTTTGIIADKVHSGELIPLSLFDIKSPRLVKKITAFLPKSNSEFSEETQYSQKQFEQEISFRNQVLQKQQSFFSRLIEALQVGVVLTDQEGICLEINSTALAFLICQKEDAFGKPLHHFLPHDPLRSAFTDVISNKPAEHTNYKQKITVESKVTELQAYPIVREKEKITGFLFLFQDITERERIKGRLQHAEKLASLGTLLSGITHELRNPLSIISARAQRMQCMKEIATLQQADKIHNALLSIIDQTARASRIIDDLLQYTRKDTIAASPQQIGRLWQMAITHTGYQYNVQSVTFRQSGDVAICVLVDPDRLIQVFINLISNALDAIDYKGVIQLHCYLSDPHTATIQVEDFGKGIAQEDQRHIFDPFFTTKGPGKGTGLGLSICSKILQQSGGSLSCKSSVGHTVFSLTLPAQKAQNDELHSRQIDHHR